MNDLTKNLETEFPEVAVERQHWNLFTLPSAGHLGNQNFIRNLHSTHHLNVEVFRVLQNMRRNNGCLGVFNLPFLTILLIVFEWICDRRTRLCVLRDLPCDLLIGDSLRCSILQLDWSGAARKSNLHPGVRILVHYQPSDIIGTTIKPFVSVRAVRSQKATDTKRLTGLWLVVHKPTLFWHLKTNLASVVE